MEVWVRMYHARGHPNPKILELLRQHYDTDKYGLGYVTRFSGQDSTDREMQVDKF
jgi:hypothetical protein